MSYSFSAVNPKKYFEVNGQNCELKSVVSELTVANNTAVVTAVSGKRIRVMGLISQGDGGTVGSFQYKSASGGTMISIPLVSPPTTNGEVLNLPVNETGYWETVTGEGLYVDCVTASLNLQTYYIEYIP